MPVHTRAYMYLKQARLLFQEQAGQAIAQAFPNLINLLFKI